MLHWFFIFLFPICYILIPLFFVGSFFVLGSLLVWCYNFLHSSFFLGFAILYFFFFFFLVLVFPIFPHVAFWALCSYWLFLLSWSLLLDFLLLLVLLHLSLWFLYLVSSGPCVMISIHVIWFLHFQFLILVSRIHGTQFDIYLYFRFWRPYIYFLVRSELRVLIFFLFLVFWVCVILFIPGDLWFLGSFLLLFASCHFMFHFWASLGYVFLFCILGVLGHVFVFLIAGSLGLASQLFSGSLGPGSLFFFYCWFLAFWVFVFIPASLWGLGFYSIFFISCLLGLLFYA